MRQEPQEHPVGLAFNITVATADSTSIEQDPSTDFSKLARDSSFPSLPPITADHSPWSLSTSPLLEALSPEVAPSASTRAATLTVETEAASLTDTDVDMGGEDDSLAGLFTEAAVSTTSCLGVDTEQTPPCSSSSSSSSLSSSLSLSDNEPITPTSGPQSKGQSVGEIKDSEMAEPPMEGTNIEAEAVDAPTVATAIKEEPTMAIEQVDDEGKEDTGEDKGEGEDEDEDEDEDEEDDDDDDDVENEDEDPNASSSSSSSESVVLEPSVISTHESIYTAVPISSHLYIIPHSSNGFHWNEDLFLKPHQRRRLGVDQMLDEAVAAAIAAAAKEQEMVSGSDVLEESSSLTFPSSSSSASFSSSSSPSSSSSSLSSLSSRMRETGVSVHEIRLEEGEMAGILPCWS